MNRRSILVLCYGADKAYRNIQGIYFPPVSLFMHMFRSSGLTAILQPKQFHRRTKNITNIHSHGWRGWFINNRIRFGRCVILASNSISTLIIQETMIVIVVAYLLQLGNQSLDTMMVQHGDQCHLVYRRQHGRVAASF